MKRTKTYAREHLRRVKNLPEDYPNRDSIISMWEIEAYMEKVSERDQEWLEKAYKLRNNNEN